MMPDMFYKMRTIILAQQLKQPLPVVFHSFV
jgi:hypothetical protein